MMLRRTHENREEEPRPGKQQAAPSTKARSDPRKHMKAQSTKPGRVVHVREKMHPHLIQPTFVTVVACRPIRRS